MFDEREDDLMAGMEPADASIAATPAEVWYDAEGNEISKSAFIREQFVKGNKSRKQISDEYNIPYRTVYGATVNMENEAEPSTRGRGITNPKIHVLAADNAQVVLKEGDKFFLNGEENADAAGMEVVEVDRNTWIKDQVAAGVNRGDIAKSLNLSYGVIYNLTKEENGGRSKHEVELEDGSVVSRSEYIRMLAASGMSKSEIAKKLDVEYSVVWQATKQVKSVAERVADAIEALRKFGEFAADEKKFAKAMAALDELTFKEPVEEPETGAPTDVQ